MMQTIPILLRPDHTESALRLRPGQVLTMVISASMLYGGVMGSWRGIGPDGWRQIIYSAIKLPMLQGVSFALTLPALFMLHTLLGLRSDFRPALRAAATTQAGIAIILASLSPFVTLFYASSKHYVAAIFFNGAMFGVSTLIGLVLLRRFYSRLIQSNPRHKTLLLIWMIAYAFVAIQMAWVMRPFIGVANESTTFFRPGAWGNAYVALWEMS